MNRRQLFTGLGVGAASAAVAPLPATTAPASQLDLAEALRAHAEKNAGNGEPLNWFASTAYAVAWGLREHIPAPSGRDRGSL